MLGPAKKIMTRKKSSKSSNPKKINPKMNNPKTLHLIQTSFVDPGDEDISYKASYATNFKENVREKFAQKYAILYPCIMSLILLVIDLMGVNNFLPESETIDILVVVRSFISYFVPTISVSATWVIAQQCFFKVPAGLAENKIPLFSLFSLIYMIFFAVFLAQNKPEPGFLFVFTGFTFIFIIIFWFSLDKDVRATGSKASGQVGIFRL